MEDQPEEKKLTKDAYLSFTRKSLAVSEEQEVINPMAIYGYYFTEDKDFKHTIPFINGQVILFDKRMTACYVDKDNKMCIAFARLSDGEKDESAADGVFEIEGRGKAIITFVRMSLEASAALFQIIPRQLCNYSNAMDKEFVETIRSIKNCHP